MSFEVDEQSVADFGGYLGAEASRTLPKIERLARDEGMSDDGFDGLLEPLGNIVNGEASELVGGAFSLMQTKLAQLGDAVISAAVSYGYVDNDSRTMLERIELEDNPADDINFGRVENRYNPVAAGQPAPAGSSAFHRIEPTIPSIDRPHTDYSEDLDVGPVLTVLDWIWSEFDVDDGKGFTDSIVSPIAGNYNSIEANGEAWTAVGTAFGELVGNMGTNATTLAANHWQGDAAEAFKQFIDVFWTNGAAWAGEHVGAFVGRGFDKVAEVSQELAQFAIDLINKIIRLAGKIATKFAPVIGWAWTAIEYAVEAAGALGGLFGLDIDIDALHENIQEIIDLARAVFGLYDHIRTIVETMQDYFTTVQELLDTITTIPDIGNLQDAVSTAQTIEQQGATLSEQKATIEAEATAANETLAEVDATAAEATASEDTGSDDDERGSGGRRLEPEASGGGGGGGGGW